MANEVTVNFISFNADLQKFADQIGVDVMTVEKRIAFSIQAKAAERMPKDTGRATANINVGIETPDLTIIPEGDYPNSVAIAEEKARSVLAGLQKPAVIWISFPLPYHKKLNEGHSKQAPANFIEQVVAEVEAEIDSLTVQP